MSSSNPNNPPSSSERRSIAARGRNLINRIAGGVRRHNHSNSRNNNTPAPAAASADASADINESQARKEKRQLSQRTLDITHNNQVPKTTRVDLDRVRQNVTAAARQWTEQEDLLLRGGVRRFGEKDCWREIAELVPDRNSLQCHQRWKKALKPGIKKGTWSGDEDNKLISLVKVSEDWSWISSQITGRNPKQCRERWFLNLDPSIKRTPWSSEEDEKLVSLESQYGGKWSIISKYIEGRTENMVKTRFHSLLRQEARMRGWSKEEDALLISDCLSTGRNYAQTVKRLPGRTKGNLKKRFADLVEKDPSLLPRVEEAERRTGGQPQPQSPALQPQQIQYQQYQPQQQSLQQQQQFQGSGGMPSKSGAGSGGNIKMGNPFIPLNNNTGGMSPRQQQRMDEFMMAMPPPITSMSPRQQQQQNIFVPPMHQQQYQQQQQQQQQQYQQQQQQQQQQYQQQQYHQQQQQQQIQQQQQHLQPQRFGSATSQYDAELEKKLLNSRSSNSWLAGVADSLSAAPRLSRDQPRSNSVKALMGIFEESGFADVNLENPSSPKSVRSSATPSTSAPNTSRNNTSELLDPFVASQSQVGGAGKKKQLVSKTTSMSMLERLLQGDIDMLEDTTNARANSPVLDTQGMHMSMPKLGNQSSSLMSLGGGRNSSEGVGGGGSRMTNHQTSSEKSEFGAMAARTQFSNSTRKLLGEIDWGGSAKSLGIGESSSGLVDGDESANGHAGGSEVEASQGHTFGLDMRVLSDVLGGI